MKIDNSKVYDLEESIIASGFPMQTGHDQNLFALKANALTEHVYGTKNTYTYSDIRRVIKLASNPSGSGHCNFLSGILVATNITATNVWWLQFERYHFAQIVSMQSKMHRLKQMLETNFVCNDKTDRNSIKRCKELLESGADDETVVYACPMGIELTARITTNYLQLKTIYNQRKNHKLHEWHTFCEWVETLPLANELITGKFLGKE